MELMFITNKVEEAVSAEQAGIDIIFVDLEINGKKERQGHLDTHIADHKIEDIKLIKSKITKSLILVRVNPLYNKTHEEVNIAINYGADIIMLPMFKTENEVKEFIKIVDKRAKVCLLLETPQALSRIKNIIEVKGIDRIHIGLNDLHLGMGLDFMFELLSGGIVEYLSDTIKYKDIKFGFGGIAKIGQGDVPAEIIIGEHYRLNSQSVILSREFREKVIHQDFTNNLIKEIKKIRDIEGKIKTWSEIDFARNREEVIERVNEVVSKKQRIYNEKK